MKSTHNKVKRGIARAFTLAAAVLALTVLGPAAPGMQDVEWILEKTPMFDVYIPGDFAYRKGDVLKTLSASYSRCSNLFRLRSRSVIRVVMYHDQSTSPAPGGTGAGGNSGLYGSGDPGSVLVPFCTDGEFSSMACTHELAKELLMACLASRANALDWFVRGSAWYAALGMNAEAAIVLGTMAAEGQVGLEKMLSGKGYAGRCMVQGFLYFLETEFGPDALRMLLESLSDHGDIKRAVVSTAGLSPVEFDRRFGSFISERMPAGTAAGQSEQPATRDNRRFFLAVPLYAGTDGSIAVFDRGLDSWSLNASIARSAAGKSLRQIAGGRFDEFYASAPYINRYAAVSGSGDICAYTIHTGSGASVFIRHAGGGPAIAEKTMPFRAVFDPALSPDGTVLVFSGYTARGSDLYAYYWKQDRLEQLTDDGAVERFPSFIPDGTAVFFSRRDARQGGVGRYGIFSAGLNGGGARPVYEDAGDDLHPSTSADGKIMVFTSVVNGYTVLKRYEADSGTATVVPGSEGGMFPLFSSDNEIVYSRFDGRSFSITRR